MNDQIGWECDACGKQIDDGAGYLTISFAEIAAVRRAVAEWEATHATGTGSFCCSGADLMSYPAPARWRTFHRDCDPSPGSADYWIDVARARTSAQFLSRAAHLFGKSWLEHTTWDDVLRCVVADLEASGQRQAA